MEPKRPLSDAELARLSVHLPKDSLASSLATSSRYFLGDPEAHHMARNISNWLSEDEDGHPPTTAPTRSTLSSLKRADRAVVRTSQPIRNSIVLGPVPYDAMHAGGPNPAATESREKLQLFPSAGSDNGSIANQPTSTTREDGHEYASGLKLILIIIVLCFSVFLMALGKLTSLPGSGVD